MGQQSQRHIRDFIFADVAAAEASGRVFETCFVQSVQTGYAYIENGGALSINHTSVLATGNGGNTRWKAIYGQYEMGKFAVPIVAAAQYTVFITQELPELVFDINGDLVMGLIDGGTI